MKFLILLGLFFGWFLSLFLGVAFSSFAAENKKAVSTHEEVKSPALPVITWSDLRKYDYKGKTPPEELKKLNNTKLRIAGYVVAFADKYDKLDEFFLVPNAQACIHTPLPPPNLIVHVKLSKPLAAEKVYNLAWIEGVFKIESFTNSHGSSAFKIMDATLDEYRN